MFNILSFVLVGELDGPLYTLDAVKSRTRASFHLPLIQKLCSFDVTLAVNIPDEYLKHEISYWLDRLDISFIL